MEEAEALQEVPATEAAQARRVEGHRIWEMLEWSWRGETG